MLPKLKARCTPTSRLDTMNMEDELSVPQFKTPESTPDIKV